MPGNGGEGIADSEWAGAAARTRGGRSVRGSLATGMSGSAGRRLCPALLWLISDMWGLGPAEAEWNGSQARFRGSWQQSALDGPCSSVPDGRHGRPAGPAAAPSLPQPDRQIRIVLHTAPLRLRYGGNQAGGWSSPSCRARSRRPPQLVLVGTGEE